MMISVVTWDAGFRESYHTVDFFSRQTLNKSKFEFIWANYYSTIKPELKEKILAMGNGRTLCFDGKGKWHLGKCINAAIRESKGDLIVITDGDIAVEEDFLEEVARRHEINQELVLYFRRWDELRPNTTTNCIELSRLIDNCRLLHPTNYGGCLTLSKRTFNHVRGYEEHDLFSEAGANGLELYTRLKNAGFQIMWHPIYKIYHPWHEGTSPNFPEYKQKINLQNWLIQKRDLNINYMADSNEVDVYLQVHKENEYPPQNKVCFAQKIKRYFTRLIKCCSKRYVGANK